MGSGVTKTIMLVDDSADDRQLLLRAFTRLGIAMPIVAIDNAPDALAFLHDSRNTQPALVLLDLKMPAYDGFSLLAKIKSHPALRNLIVIVLTTSSALRDIQLAYELGANSFLTKPFDLGEFRAMVSAFYNYWVVQNQPLPKGLGPHC